MFRRTFWIALLFWTLSIVFARQQPSGAQEALLGFDPVILIEESREVLGEESISLVRGGFWYLFASQESKGKFEASPERYEIQKGGVCARMGGTTPGQPDNYLVHDGRIYIFGSENCRTLFAAHPEKYLEPDRGAVKTTSEGRRRGMALIDKAVDFLGGASRIDALRTLHQTGFQGPDDRRVQVEIWRAFPDRWKFLVHHPRYGDYGRLITDSGAYRLNATVARPLTPGVSRNVRVEMLRDPLEIIRARKQPDFEAALVEGDESRVRTRIGDVETVLSIDPSSGEIREVSYLGRGEEGEVGTVVKRFSDYRKIDGVLRPFRIEAGFEGVPFDEETLVVESIEVDSTLETALFAANTSGGR